MFPPTHTNMFKRIRIHTHSDKTSSVCCVCSIPSILVYGSVDTAAQCLLTFRNPVGCPVLCLKHSANFLFAGLRDGTVLVYQRQNGGEPWCSMQCFSRVYLPTCAVYLPCMYNTYVYFAYGMLLTAFICIYLAFAKSINHFI